MPKEIESHNTPLEAHEAGVLLYEACRSQLGQKLGMPGLRLLVAHWAIETGYGARMRCYNFGNVKYSSKHPTDFQYFTTHEYLDPDKVPSGGIVEKLVMVSGKQTAYVRFERPHPACCFVAHETAQQGAEFFVLFLQQHYSEAVSVLENGGSTADYAQALRVKWYYTAPVAQYVTALTNAVNKLSKLVEIPQEVDVGVVLGHISVSLQSLSEELTEEDRKHYDQNGQ